MADKDLFEYSGACMSPPEAAVFLRQFDAIPTFGGELAKMVPSEGLKAKLTDAFCGFEGVSRDSVERKVRNWLSGKNAPQNREDVFICAFTLGLSEEQTSLLLGVCDDAGIHYRDARELTYAYALRRGYDYERAADLFASLPDGKEYGLTSPPSIYTFAVREAFRATNDDDGFRSEFAAHLYELGTSHNRAYYYFRQFTEALFTPSEDDDAYGVELVIDTYLSPHIAPGRSRRGLDQVQKLIRRAFPNASDLRGMLARRIDIPRKLLLLLYIVTEASFDEYSEADEDYISDRERFDNHWWCVNLMLSDCGMPVLDPRNPYDWLVLFSLNTSDADESMLDRFDAVLSYLFGGEYPE